MAEPPEFLLSPRTRAVIRYRRALEKIAAAGPTEGPDYEDWGGSTEAAAGYGVELGLYQAAEIARAALKEETTP